MVVECKDSIAGIKELFLSPFYKLPRRAFLMDNGSFPDSQRTDFTYMYGSNFTESLNSEEGFDQSLNFKVLKLQADTFKTTLRKNEWRAIVKDYNGSWWVLGAMNGLSMASHEGLSGTGKTDFTGYNFTLSGKEEEEIYKINNADAFIIDAILFLSSSSELSSTESTTAQKYI